MTDIADENLDAEGATPDIGVGAASAAASPARSAASSAIRTGAAPDELAVHRTLRADVWRQFRRHKGAIFGLFVISVITLSVLIGPFIYPADPFEIELDQANLGMSSGYQELFGSGAGWGLLALVGLAIVGFFMKRFGATRLSPWIRYGIPVGLWFGIGIVNAIGESWTYPFGTDNLGRDVLVRGMIGGRVSLSVGFAAMLFGLVIGVSVGVVAGFIRWLDGPLMRLTDLFLSLPLLPLLLVAVLFFRDPMTERFGENMGVFLLVVIIIGATSWMQTARVVRGDVLAIKEEEFVIAAESVGTRTTGIILRHILPNVMSSIIVSASLGVAGAILTESAISFLGLGFPADLPTWGRLLSDGRNYMQINIWRTIVPGALISLTVLSVNFIGDGLRDALDPKLRSKG